MLIVSANYPGINKDLFKYHNIIHHDFYVYILKKLFDF